MNKARLSALQQPFIGHVVKFVAYIAVCHLHVNLVDQCATNHGSWRCSDGDAHIRSHNIGCHVGIVVGGVRVCMPDR